MDPAVQLLLIDVMMPRLDGLSAVMRIRDRRNLPIIVLSARSEETDKILGLSVGADDYVTKPFSPQELAARVRSQLRRYTRLGDVHGEARQDEIVNGRLVYRPGDLVLARRRRAGAPHRHRDPDRGPADAEPGAHFSGRGDLPPGVGGGVLCPREHRDGPNPPDSGKRSELNPRQPEYLKVVWGIGYKMEKKT